MGQFPPPSFMVGMEELASIADTSGQIVNLRQAAAVIGDRPRHTGDGCSPENLPPPPATVMKDHLERMKAQGVEAID
jgi:hypothetical protein